MRKTLFASALLAVTMAGLSIIGRCVVAQENEFSVITGQRQLFLDDWGIAKMENLTRTLHQPAKKGAVIRPMPGDLDLYAIQTRTAPIWDPEKKVWKFWDCTTPNELHEKKAYCSGYYESADGLHWSKPVVGQVEYKGSRANNFITILAGDKHLRPDCVAYDPTDSDPSRRFKTALPGYGFATSPDGITWKAMNVEAVPSQDEYNLSFDLADHQFILTVKRGGPYGRSVHLATSKDFEHWTDHGLIFHADDLDQELGRKNIEARLTDPTLNRPVNIDPAYYKVDVYNMGLFRYEGLYIGTPAMFHSTGPDGNNTDGFHLVQLVSSRDLKSWNRVGDRKTFIGPSPLGAGAYDQTQIIGPSYPIFRGDELWFYYTGTKYRSTPEVADIDTGAINLAVLRRDGFVSLDAGEKEGILLTKPFKLKGEKLYVNVNAPKDELRIEVLDKEGKTLAVSSPLNGDLPRGEVQWEKGNLADLNEKTVSLRFVLRNAKLYSYWLGK